MFHFLTIKKKNEHFLKRRLAVNQEFLIGMIIAEYLER